ncbi:MAG: glycine betaine ABC transporter substrate-binding protein [Solirubrobacteraceae bacterium]|nr:glycine betaine ABC transporter substrate-binding protein [Solirubrobacteraceae bacterium]
MSGSTTHPASPSRGRHLSRALTALALAAVTSTGLAACGSDDEPAAGGGGGQSSSSAAIVKNDANASKTLKLGSKNFTEQQVLGEVYAQALEAKGYKIQRDFSIGSEKIALKALEDKQIDAYPEYTGTALTNFFDVPSDEIPKDSTQAYDLMKDKFETEKQITALPPTPFTNSNAVGVTEALAKKDNLVNISDLSKVAGDLTLSGSPECRSRIDCLKGLEGTYGLKFKKYVPVDVALRHEVLTTGKADISILFGTDPQIARDKFVVLKDDKKLFPPYNVSMLARDDVIDEAGPDFAKTIDLVNTKLDAKVIQELNAKVDLDKETPEAAAKSYLTQFGFVESGS